jgi:gliding motility-associated-like protein
MVLIIWNVKGVNANFNSNSIIFIYDRYGKLITRINTNSQGWDGTFNEAFGVTIIGIQ